MSIHQANLRVDSLVLYKIHPARVLSIGDKIEIGLDKGQTKRVRPKDIELLHPGPLRSLGELVPREGELEEAWELLEGGETNLSELAELVFDELTPTTAWAAWQLVADGLYFSGTPQAIEARDRVSVEAVFEASRQVLDDPNVDLPPLARSNSRGRILASGRVSKGDRDGTEEVHGRADHHQAAGG